MDISKQDEESIKREIKKILSIYEYVPAGYKILISIERQIHHALYKNNVRDVRVKCEMASDGYTFSPYDVKDKEFLRRIFLE